MKPEQNIYIRTFGCSANQADSEAIGGLLVKAGFTLVDNFSKADCVIINSCFVKSRTEHAVTREVKKALSLKKKLIVAGCMPEVLSEELKKLAPNASLVGTHKINQIVKVVQSKKPVYLLGKVDIPKICMPRLRKNKIVAIVPISSGCLGNCSYCCVKFAKGRLFSYPKELILKEVENAVAEGCKEVWVTAQDCANYGLDNGKASLPDLLEKICSIEGNFLVRIGMIDPDNILKILEELIEIYKHPKIFKFLHIPVQSGSNKILKAMNRKYKVEDFRKIIQKFRKEIPNITISTDIICGFPGETEKQFEDTLKLIIWLQPDFLNISRFWPRPRTAAASMPDQILGVEIKRRSTQLTRLYDKIALENNRNWIGWKGKVLIDEVGSSSGLVGRNQSYKPIVLHSKNLETGKLVRAKLTEAHRNYLIGEVLK